MPFLPLIGIFIGFVFILTIKFRKSPFDLSMSHHAHQELVRGLTNRISHGRTLGWIEISHWYENVFLLGFVIPVLCQRHSMGSCYRRSCLSADLLLRSSHRQLLRKNEMAVCFQSSMDSGAHMRHR